MNEHITFKLISSSEQYEAYFKFPFLSILYNDVILLEKSYFAKSFLYIVELL